MRGRTASILLLLLWRASEVDATGFNVTQKENGILFETRGSARQNFAFITTSNFTILKMRLSGEVEHSKHFRMALRSLDDEPLFTFDYDNEMIRVCGSRSPKCLWTAHSPNDTYIVDLLYNDTDGHIQAYFGYVEAVEFARHVTLWSHLLTRSQFHTWTIFHTSLELSMLQDEIIRLSFFMQDAILLNETGDLLDLPPIQAGPIPWFEADYWIVVMWSTTTVSGCIFGAAGLHLAVSWLFKRAINRAKLPVAPLKPTRKTMTKSEIELWHQIKMLDRGQIPSCLRSQSTQVSGTSSTQLSFSDDETVDLFALNKT